MCLQLETLPSPEVHWTAHNPKRIATFYGAQAPTRKRHTKLAWFVDSLAWFGFTWFGLALLGLAWLGLKMKVKCGKRKQLVSFVQLNTEMYPPRCSREHGQRKCCKFVIQNACWGLLPWTINKPQSQHLSRNNARKTTIWSDHQNTRQERNLNFYMAKV